MTGWDRKVAEVELSYAKKQLTAMTANNAALAKYGTLKAEQARLDQGLAAEKLSLDRATAASDFAGSKFTLTGDSTASVDRNLTRMIADAAAFTEILAGLKAKGASPWLLQKLVEAGPTKTAIRLGRQYLNDSAPLASINAKFQLLSQTASAFGQLTADPRFSSDAAWGGLATTTRTTLVKIEALDTTPLTSEIQRVVRHELATIANGGGA